jgi:hypothetical protein
MSNSGEKAPGSVVEGGALARINVREMIVIKIRKNISISESNQVSWRQ